MTLYYHDNSNEKIFINTVEDFVEYAEWIFRSQSMAEEIFKILKNLKKKLNVSFLNVSNLNDAIFIGTFTDIAQYLDLITPENLEYFFRDNEDEHLYFEEVKEEYDLSEFVSIYFIEEILNKKGITDYIWLFPNDLDDTQEYNCIFLPHLLIQDAMTLTSIIDELKTIENMYDDPKPITMLIEKLQKTKSFNL